MADDEMEHPPRGYATSDVEALRTKPRRRWKLKLALISLLAVPITVAAIWTWITLSYTYSSGERAGFIQKFSEKGWLCKTWEGEIAMANLPGTMPQIFQFTVRDEAVAREINANLGKRVAIHYDQHKAVPFSCFGETEYFVNGVRVAE